MITGIVGTIAVLLIGLRNSYLVSRKVFVGEVIPVCKVESVVERVDVDPVLGLAAGDRNVPPPCSHPLDKPYSFAPEIVGSG